ncbi:16S rRNA (adenine(1518)-N(6)/adenine(1519)-N(6))-dimethyltransferase RsmA [Olavius algarvensis spirochete endosymbiont]|uniref:16S rRNA (adenine(1518)-N(6)/adenine(1519)-N(6))- dimethyltransferase RsmA n=1 Tax=Olavius algarvensis spirochete endosymbiont TaxID=260710 RepID=UPI0027D2E5D7|nr:16S rRNA (adenine(1518)-N(6)/adenine(1519)-N(6))-dimethyltransferase RsmA [Olavius algarvensis spirochete endosymbiont]
MRSFLAKRKLAPRRRWGQNFLINRGAREKLISHLEIVPGQKIWEIGAGLGAMSEMILDRGAQLTVFEIDSAYCDWLNEYLRGREICVLEGDVMKNWRAQRDKHKIDRILGNLPYNVASATISALIENRCLTPINIFVVQEEMCERIISKPGLKTYSSFSVLCQTGAIINDIGRLSPGSFYPRPRVNSRMILMRPAEPYGRIEDPAQFRLLVRTSFSSRRKILSNCLDRLDSLTKFPTKESVKEAFHAEKINLRQRPEAISPGQWVTLSNRIAKS